MKGTVCALLAACAALAPRGAAAQLPLPVALELRGGLAFPLGDFREVGSDIGEGLGSGYTLGGSVTLELTPRVGAYVGYSYTRFDIEEFGTIDIVTDGVDAGVRVALPMAAVAAPWLRGGVVYHDADIVHDGPGTGPGQVGATGRELGFEVGGGAEVRLGRRLSLTPGLSYVRFGTDSGFAGGAVTYLRGDVGLRFRP
ncbi:MAG TPA: outer membrane beta-barrel protein [Longimicrobiaceae bacterium]|nr:outer membrane beta-barrel protein [Longimicrobiaceae bacterium]